jgi:hypothetical protein
VPSRYTSTMESIPEQSRRPSHDTNLIALLSALPSSAIILEDTSIPEHPTHGPVNRPTSSRSMLPIRKPAVTPPEEPRVIALATPPPGELAPRPNSLPELTSLPEAASPEEISCPIPVQRSVSLPLELTIPVSLPRTQVDVEVKPTLEVASRKPSLVERIFHPFSERLGGVEEPVEGRELTPPPRAAALPHLSRVQTVAVSPLAREV